MAGWEISENAQYLKGYVQNAHRYDYGTQSAALAHGLKAAVEFMEEIGMKRVEDYSTGLSQHLYSGLQEIGDPLEILTPEEEALLQDQLGVDPQMRPAEVPWLPSGSKAMIIKVLVNVPLKINTGSGLSLNPD